ncbi:hypothetical protein QR680_016849 [Steinernema hermaphroditum]|uniref:Uncharacterized protein n=1 Tax=Steinernema hermaphroditum TaxID=289476 RepID=A0AA39HCX1_9BILA|nr:hypothetical protein QR680_016849 [Steinernema hermaphroditum]
MRMPGLLALQNLRISVVRRAGSSSQTPRFSESTAYFGNDRMGASRGARRVTPGAAFKPDYYTSDEFKRKKLLSFLLSFGAFVAYFGWLRESSDLDEIMSTPPHILSANLERRMIREQIEEAQKKGKDTTLLQAQLEYVDVKEAALKTQFEKKNK